MGRPTARRVTRILHFDRERDLKSLVRRIKEAEAYAERPALAYAAFSVKQKDFAHDFKSFHKRLEAKLDDKE